MLFGIIIGTYSSIFVAAPLLLLFGVKREWSEEKAGAKAKQDAKQDSKARGAGVALK
jgi:preprotein translocase subunit SecF